MNAPTIRTLIASSTILLVPAGCADQPPGEVPRACGVPAPDGADIPEGEVFETLGRLAIADLDDGVVAVWDLDVDRLVTCYELEAPAELHAASNRQITAVIAVQPTAGRFDVLATGVWVWDHVDHFHVYKDPNVIQIDPDVAYVGGLTNVVVNAGWVVAADDETGRATALFERSIGPLRRDVPRSRLPIFRAVEGEPHDVQALVARGQLFATRADGGVDRYRQEPEGFEDPVTLACRAPGEVAGAGREALFDCADDMLLSRWNEETEAFEDLRVERPAGVARPTDLFGEDDLASYVGRVDGGLLLVGRETAAATFVPIAGEITAVGADRDGQILLVVLDSGELLDLDPATGEERRRLDLDAGSPLFDVAVGEGIAYLSEPDAGLVHAVELDGFRPIAPVEVGGRPGSLAVTALWPGGEPVRH